MSACSAYNITTMSKTPSTRTKAEALSKRPVPKKRAAQPKAQRAKPKKISIKQGITKVMGVVEKTLHDTSSSAKQSSK